MNGKITYTFASAVSVGLLLLACSDSSLSQSYETPRTPWGHPDLTGIWTNSTITPIERPDDLGDKAFFTEEEFAEIAKMATVAVNLNALPCRSHQPSESSGYDA